ncbi:MAG: hypothetical protein JW785_03820 [Acidimicrobiia bacterium]|nr:hypothetical protein [Acidimicrobiia bacterium]
MRFPWKRLVFGSLLGSLLILQLVIPGPASSSQTGTSESDMADVLDIALDLPAEQAHSAQFEQLLEQGSRLTAASVSADEILVAMIRGGFREDAVRQLRAELPEGARIREALIALPGEHRTTTSWFVVRDDETFEQALGQWKTFERDALLENIEASVASLNQQQQAAVLSVLEPGDAAETLANSAAYVSDARGMLGQLESGSYLVYGIGVAFEPGSASLAIDVLRRRGLALGSARSLMDVSLLPPLDPARDANLAAGRVSDRLRASGQSVAATTWSGDSLLSEYAYERHIDRYGVMTWTPLWADPDFFYRSQEDVNVLESDIYFGSAFRVSGHDAGWCAGGECVYASYEWEFFTEDEWGHGYATNPTYFNCDLPSVCTTDLIIDDAQYMWHNYAAVTGNASAIAANTEYHIDIGIEPTSVTQTHVQLRSVAGAITTDCPIHNGSLPDPAWCSFENYGHRYNKTRELLTPQSYFLYYGGSYITDNTFSPCPGEWGFAAGHVDYWCYTGTNGPEPPGRVTIRPQVGYSTGYAYRTVTRTIEPGDDFSVEYVVQCLTGNPCNGKLAWEGRDGVYPVETRPSPTFTIPNDGWYYLCRFDSLHGATNSADYQHSSIRAKLFNTDAADQLRIDAMALYGWVDYQTGFITPTDNATCNRVSQG